jgi:hypothetical protein
MQVQFRIKLAGLKKKKKLVSSKRHLLNGKLVFEIGRVNEP